HRARRGAAVHVHWLHDCGCGAGVGTVSEYKGIVKDMPDAEYRAAPGYGSTALKWFLEEVPAQAKHWIDQPEERPSFPAASVGQLLHAIVLKQPPPFVVKDWDARTKDGKVRAEEVAAQGLIGLS